MSKTAHNVLKTFSKGETIEFATKEARYIGTFESYTQNVLTVQVQTTKTKAYTERELFDRSKSFHLSEITQITL